MGKLDDIFDSVTDISGKVADKSAKIYEKMKIKAEIHNKRTELNKELVGLGKNAYKLYNCNETTDEYTQLLAQRDEFVEKIDQIRKDLKKLKELDSIEYI